jgi:hypothetical protein
MEPSYREAIRLDEVGHPFVAESREFDDCAVGPRAVRGTLRDSVSENRRRCSISDPNSNDFSNADAGYSNSYCHAAAGNADADFDSEARNAYAYANTEGCDPDADFDSEARNAHAHAIVYSDSDEDGFTDANVYGHVESNTNGEFGAGQDLRFNELARNPANGERSVGKCSFPCGSN